jgi:hypothetical protein
MFERKLLQIGSFVFLSTTDWRPLPMKSIPVTPSTYSVAIHRKGLPKWIESEEYRDNTLSKLEVVILSHHQTIQHASERSSKWSIHSIIAPQGAVELLLEQ